MLGKINALLKAAPAPTYFIYATHRGVPGHPRTFVGGAIGFVGDYTFKLD